MTDTLTPDDVATLKDYRRRMAKRGTPAGDDE